MKKINKVILKASEQYNNYPLLRGTVTLIPFIGSALDILFQEKWNKTRQNRINYFLETVENELKTIDENKINKSFLESDEFGDLVFNCISNSAKTRHKEKIELFAKNLRKAVSQPNFDFDLYEELESIIEKLTSKEIQFLNILEDWEDNIENDYLELLGISDVRVDLNNTGILGIPKYYSFWERFEEQVKEVLDLTETELNLLQTVIQQKGLIEIGNFDYSRNSPLQAARESFKPVMKAQLTKIYFLLKKFILDEN